MPPAPDPQQTGKDILLYCYGAFELKIILRLRAGLASRGRSIIVVTHLPSIWVRVRAVGLRCVLLRAFKGDVPAPTHLLSATPEGVLRQISQAQADRFSKSLWDALDRTTAAFPVGAIALFNGLRLGGRITTAFANERNLPTVFFELGNVEPKLFIDQEGVNAASRLERHPELVDAFDASDEELAAWRIGFIERKRQLSRIPQAGGRLAVNYWYIFDWVAVAFLRTPQALPLSIRERLAFKIRLWRQRVTPAIKPDRPYIFLPLQVSYDVNLLLFSDYDNISAIRFAAARAKELGLQLVVKPHPAEQDALVTAKINALCAEAGYLVTSFNTAELILGAEEVVTINSTVGLEARLMGRPVTQLGRSLYGAFSDRQAILYASRYLLDFAPFGDAPASQAVVSRIIDLIESAR